MGKDSGAELPCGERTDREGGQRSNRKSGSEVREVGAGVRGWGDVNVLVTGEWTALVPS